MEFILTKFHHDLLRLTSPASAYLLTEVAVANMTQRQFVSLGMFIVDQFLFEDKDGNPTGRTLDPQVRLCGYSGDSHVCLLLTFSPLLQRGCRSEVEEPTLLLEPGSG